MSSTAEYLTFGLVVCLVLLLVCKSGNAVDNFGIDEKPFDPYENTLNRGPWDNIDYIVPKYVV